MGTKTSLWLVPADPDRARLQHRISGLAAELTTPTFQPHITLVSAELPRGAVVEAIEAAAATWPPLRLRAGSTDHGVERFKALFVRFDDARIPELAADLADHLGVSFDRSGFDPHLSLLYRAGMPDEQRRALARRETVTGAELVFDTLAASRPGEDRDDVARWELSVVRRLRGGAGLPAPR